MAQGGDWSDLRDSLGERYANLRPTACAHVAAAMVGAGVASGEEHARALAAAWFERWIDKAADELHYLALDRGERARVATVDGAATVADEVSGGSLVLLVGAHLGPHTLAWVQLDAAMPLTIIVHPTMMAIKDEYAMANAEWLTYGDAIAPVLYRAARRGGVVVTYADVLRDGSPRCPGVAPDDELRRVVDLAGASVFSVDVTPSEPGRSRSWAITVDPLPAAGIHDWADARVRSRPEQWMLWRRVPATVFASADLPWPSAAGGDD